jgi:biopolymer transport protein ExbD
MADMQLPQKNSRRKTQTLRVDLTPMVDLGFLLIAFFMYTTTMAKPNAMEVNMPVTSEKKTPFCEECTVTLMPTRDHKLVYYKGALDHPEKTAVTNFEANGLRAALIHAQQQVKALPARFSKDAHELHVIIKPNDDCTYEDVVKVLDEMSILDIKYYAMTDITAAEKELLTKKLQ